ncbi:hypothetical protein GCM10009621_04160 [Corynebacterium felinum]
MIVGENNNTMTMNSWLADLPMPILAQISALIRPEVEDIRALAPELSPQQAQYLAQLLHGDPQAFTPLAQKHDSAQPNDSDVDTQEGEPNTAAQHAATPAPDTADADDRWDFGTDAWDGESSEPCVDENDFLQPPLHAFAPFNWSSDTRAKDTVTAKAETPATPATSDEDTPDTSTNPTSVLVYWEHIDAGDNIVFYRLVGSNKEEQCSPESGDILVHTKGRAFRDTIPPHVGMRHYMVWAYVGPNAKEAIKTQPIFVGETALALPPRDFSLVETNGTVSGTWTPLIGHEDAQVFVREHGHNTPLDIPQCEIREGVTGRNFTYTVPTRGKTYDFQVFPGYTFRGVRRRGHGSAIITRTISANIQQVEITTAFRIPGVEHDQIHLSWIAPPTGEVKIYLTCTEPKPDMIGLSIDSSYIADDEALGTTEWVSTYEREPGTQVDETVIWPSDWSQVYCVPVNVVGDKSMVGTFKVVNRVSPIKEYSLHERVSSQLITFDWPQGAALVQVHSSQSNISEELVEEDYRRQGGIRLKLHHLGDTVTLAPKSLYAGIYTEAEVTEIAYDGLKTYSYGVIHSHPHGQDISKLWIWRNDAQDRKPPTFVMVYNEERLPLHINDGTPVTTAPYQSDGTYDARQAGRFIVPVELANGPDEAYDHGRGMHWALDLKDTAHGFIRLFIQHDLARAHSLGTPVVLDDYAVASLNLASRMQVEQR